MVRACASLALLASALLVFCSPAEAVGGAGARSATAGGHERMPQPRLTFVPHGSVTVPDPEGGRPWTIRVARTGGGKHCALVGQRGRPAARSCSHLTAARPFAVSITGTPRRTVVAGVIRPEVLRVELLGIHARKLAVTQRGRGFIAVLPGDVPAQELPVKMTRVDGASEVVDWGAGASLETLDPVSGERWRLMAGGPRRWGPRTGQTCAQFLPTDGSVTGEHNLSGDVVCGDLRTAPFAVKMLDYAGRRGPSSDPVTTRRTVVVGVAGKRVAAVDVVAPAGTQRLELTTVGRSFLAIFPPDVPAAALRVVFTFADGTTQTVDRSTNVATLPPSARAATAGAERKLTVLEGGALTVPDPEGGKPWRLRVARSDDGLQCTLIGQQGKRADRECIRPPKRRTYTAHVARFHTRTLVYGQVGPDVVRVELVGLHARTVRLTRRGRAFLAVFAGSIPEQQLPLKVTSRGGVSHVNDWSASEFAESLDPVSGERWTFHAGGPYPGPVQPGESCAYFDPVDSSVARNLTLAGGRACGVLGPTPYTVRISRFVLRRMDRTPVGRRTVVTGVVGPEVAAVTVVGPDGPRQLELTSPARGFLAVFAPQVRPSSLRVVLTFADGTTKTVARTTNVVTSS